MEAEGGDEVDPGDGGNDDAEADGDDEPDEYVHVDEKYFWMDYTLKIFGILHLLVAIAMVIGYYTLKVILTSVCWLIKVLLILAFLVVVSGPACRLQKREGSSQTVGIRRPVSF